MLGFDACTRRGLPAMGVRWLSIAPVTMATITRPSGWRGCNAAVTVLGIRTNGGQKRTFNDLDEPRSAAARRGDSATKIGGYLQFVVAVHW